MDVKLTMMREIINLCPCVCTYLCIQAPLYIQYIGTRRPHVMNSRVDLGGLPVGQRRETKLEQSYWTIDLCLL